jgi:two-component system, OmpR family, sensor kinase
MSLSASSGGVWRSARRLPDRTPLRVKLISAVLVLVALALAVISLVGVAVLRTYLFDQANDQLQGLGQQAATLVQRYIFNQDQNTSSQLSLTWTPSGALPEQVVQPVQGFGEEASRLPGPKLPSSADWIAANAGKPVVVGARSGGRKWLVEVYPDQTFDFSDNSTVSGTVVLGTDVTTAYMTIRKLTSIDLIVSLIALTGLAVVGVALVRASLRPLTEIEATAQGIAAGDLSRRVPERDPRTEIGRLGRSLNAMLAQIETAFRARADSESAARKSEERMRQFVADASHELRTPLTAIRGFAEYYRQRGGLDLTPSGQTPDGPAPAGPVRDDPVPDGQPAIGQGSLPPADLDRIMRRVEQESARMGVLVEDMLLLARLDQQRPLEHRPIDLLTLAADAVHDARVVAPERSINLTVGSGTALLVLGDEVRLRQVIGNLMTNALVHTPDGTPIDVRIRSGSFDEGPGLRADAITPGMQPPAAELPAAELPAAGPLAAVLEVADRGPGLTPAQAERAFERFYRADQARTSGGTGLGLAIVAALVAAHGGRVWVESPPGGGAIFRIALPLAPEALGTDTDADADADADAEQQEHELAGSELDGGELDGNEHREPEILDSHPKNPPGTSMMGAG